MAKLNDIELAVTGMKEGKDMMEDAKGSLGEKAKEKAMKYLEQAIDVVKSGGADPMGVLSEMLEEACEPYDSAQEDSEESSEEDGKPNKALIIAMLNKKKGSMSDDSAEESEEEAE